MPANPLLPVDPGLHAGPRRGPDRLAAATPKARVSLIRSYSVAFVGLFVGLLVLTDLATSSIAYRHATRVSLDLAADTLSEASAKVVASTTALLDGARAFAEIGALAVAERGLDDHQALFRLFGRQLQLLPGLAAIHVAGPGGDLIEVRNRPRFASRLIRPDDQGAAATERLVFRNRAFEPIAHINEPAADDPRDQAWYQQALAADGLIWSPVYRFAAAGEPGVTAALAVRDAAGALIGVVGVDIALRSLSELLAPQQLARGSIALVVDGTGRLIAFPPSLKLAPDTAGQDSELPMIDDLQARWVVDAFRLRTDARTGTSGIKRVAYVVTETDGKGYLGVERPFPSGVGDDWRLLTVVPETSLLESARRLFSQATAISFILLLIASVAVSYLALRLLQPLRRLVRNTKLVREFRFAEVRRVQSWFNEIKAMDDALWRMSQGLRALEKFVPKDIGRQLIATGERAAPGAEVRELALLVTGASEMASLCGALTPERITERIARDIDVFTETILRHNGTIDNFLGESILAFWGAPVAIDRAAERSCLAALACRDAEAELRAGWAASSAADDPPPHNVFSVHYGRVIVGTIGSRQRMNWTAIGDNVTLAWDLHQLNRHYGTRILITGSVQRRVADRFWTRRLDRVPRGNGAPPLELFELVDSRERRPTAARLESIERYENGLRALFEADWPTAEASFTALAERDPQDAAVAMMLARCRARDASLWTDGPDSAGEPDANLIAARAIGSRSLNLGAADGGLATSGAQEVQDE
ncbi:MAG: cache domain-containing protein [Lamprobacter sp.]|uniref:cache domain-containing protein n=1 Tax=Lamprobacter sp. TaxID=3100796 RepID=UPI002B25D2A8|nr:cache domain-containing protein [Lamprobacter sp.]MEA3640640.1 cache domain-containing protein [Lamprobacter sp.]